VVDRAGVETLHISTELGPCSPHPMSTVREKGLGEMPTITERAIAMRRKQLPDYTVRCRTGPRTRDWTRIGSAWERTNAEGKKIVTVVLSALPLTINNRVVLKLLEPLEADEDVPEEEAPADAEETPQIENRSRRRRQDPPPPDGDPTD
jgi:hypothetical protein